MYEMGLQHFALCALLLSEEKGEHTNSATERMSQKLPKPGHEMHSASP